MVQARFKRASTAFAGSSCWIPNREGSSLSSIKNRSEKRPANTSITTTTNMSDVPITAITSTTTTNKSNNDNGKKLTEETATNKKKRSGTNLLRVALYMIRRKSNGKSKPVHVDVASEGMWKKLVGSMRPLHLQHNNRSPPHTITIAATPESPAVIEQYEDVFPPPMSPNGPCTPSSSSSSSCDDGMSSRYASAVNLQELDKSDHCGAEINEDGEDLMIDAKADEFIAQFYQQMKIQRLNSINNRYNEMIARGLR